MKITLLCTLAACISATLAVPATQKVMPVAEFDGMVYDFDTVSRDDIPLSHDFVVRNTGDSPLLMVKVTTTCPCTTVDYPVSPIAPGDSARLVVTYSSASLGSFNQCVYLSTNDSVAHRRLMIKGVVADQK